MQLSVVYIVTTHRPNSRVKRCIDPFASDSHLQMEGRKLGPVGNSGADSNKKKYGNVIKYQFSTPPKKTARKH